MKALALLFVLVACTPKEAPVADEPQAVETTTEETTVEEAATEEAVHTDEHDHSQH